MIYCRHSSSEQKCARGECRMLQPVLVLSSARQTPPQKTPPPKKNQTLSQTPMLPPPPPPPAQCPPTKLHPPPNPPSPHTGSTGCSRGKKMIFLKNHLRPCATLKQVFLDCFDLVVAHFDPPRIPKCLEYGLFWDQKWVKNRSKTHFSKPHPRPFGVHKQVK